MNSGVLVIVLSLKNLDDSWAILSSASSFLIRLERFLVFCVLCVKFESWNWNVEVYAKLSK